MGRIIFILVSIFLFSVKASAQDMMGLLGESPFDTILEMDNHRAGSVSQTSLNAVHHFPKVGQSRIGMSGRYLELGNHLSGVPNYYNISGSLTYQRFLDEGRFLNLSGHYGSASDKPFKNGRDGAIMVNGVYKLDSHWLLLGNYSNNRTFLNNVPLPGAVYVKEASRERTMIFGFPFVFIQVPLGNGDVSVRYLGLLPYNHRLRFLYQKLSWFKPYVTYEQGPLVFFNSNRSSHNQRTFWFERRLGLGAEKSFGPVLKFDLQSGLAFDRQFFDAKSYSKKKSNVIDVQRAAYVMISLKTMF